MYLRLWVNARGSTRAHRPFPENVIDLDLTRFATSSPRERVLGTCVRPGVAEPDCEPVKQEIERDSLGDVVFVNTIHPNRAQRTERYLCSTGSGGAGLRAGQDTREE